MPIEDSFCSNTLSSNFFLPAHKTEHDHKIVIQESRPCYLSLSSYISKYIKLHLHVYTV